MKRLVLLRHAKSLQDTSVKDKERPLNDRGRNDAPRMGVYMHHRRYIPQLVLCSPSKRTAETWELLAPELDASPDVRFVEALYLAPAPTIAKLVRAVAPGVQTLLVIGHNPGLEDCAQAFARKPVTGEERKRDAALRTKFPTCALAVLDFDVESWPEAAAGSGILADFERPKGLHDT
jgi:phosphohistidine phosphatase